MVTTKTTKSGRKIKVIFTGTTHTGAVNIMKGYNKALRQSGKSTKGVKVIKARTGYAVIHEIY